MSTRCTCAWFLGPRWLNMVRVAPTQNTFTQFSVAAAMSLSHPPSAGPPFSVPLHLWSKCCCLGTLPPTYGQVRTLAFLTYRGLGTELRFAHQMRWTRCSHGLSALCNAHAYEQNEPGLIIFTTTIARDVAKHTLLTWRSSSFSRPVQCADAFGTDDPKSPCHRFTLPYRAFLEKWEGRSTSMALR